MLQAAALYPANDRDDDMSAAPLLCHIATSKNQYFFFSRSSS